MHNYTGTTRLLLTAFVTALLNLLPGTSMAAQITLDPSSTGSISQIEFQTIQGTFSNYGSNSPLTSLDYYPPEPIGQVKSRALAYGFLLFDVAMLPFLAESAAIEFDLAYARSASPRLTITSLSAAQAQALAGIPPGTAYYSLYDAAFGTPEQAANYVRAQSGYRAIGGGAALGTLNSAGPLSGLYSVSLNNTALNAINSAGGLIGFGLIWTPSVDIVDDPFPHEEGNDHLFFNVAPHLVLSGSASVVPLPGTLMLVTFGMALMRRVSNCTTRLRR